MAMACTSKTATLSICPVCLQSAQENIDLQTTILSRFDLIFIVKDTRDFQRDLVGASARQLTLLASDSQTYTLWTVMTPIQGFHSCSTKRKLP